MKTIKKSSSVYQLIRKQLAVGTILLFSICADCLANFDTSSSRFTAILQSSFSIQPADNNEQYLYEKQEFISRDEGGYSTLESHYETLEQRDKNLLQAPTLIPIAGDITIFIPVHKRPKLVGGALVQRTLILRQIRDFIGKTIINSEVFGNEQEQINTLYNNTLRFALTSRNQFGHALDPSQVDEDIIWPETKNINGQNVIVPVLYLSQNTIQLNRPKDHENGLAGGTAVFGNITIHPGSAMQLRNEFLHVTQNLVNQGNINVSDSVQELVIGGAFDAVGGSLRAVKDLKLQAGTLSLRPVVAVRRDKYGFIHEVGDVSSISADGVIDIKTAGDQLLVAAQVEGKSIQLNAGGSILVGGIKLESAYSNKKAKWQEERSSSSYLGSKLKAKDAISLIAAKEIKIEGSEIASDEGHIELLAGMGITILDELTHTRTYSKHKWKNGSAEETAYKTVAMRSVLDAGKDIRIHAQAGDITIKAADISSVSGTSVSALGGAVKLLMTTETDHYSYNYQSKNLFTQTTKSRGKLVETGVPNSIVGGFAVEALNGVTVEYEGDKSLSLDQQVEQLSTLPGLEWVAEVKAATPNVNWNEVETQYKTWNESSTSLTPAFAAVVAICVTVLTQDYSGQLASGLMGGSQVASAYPAIAAAMQSGVGTLISQGAVAVGNGVVDGDIAGAMRDFASTDTLKTLAVSMITAGAIAKLDGAFFDANAVEASKINDDSILFVKETKNNAIVIKQSLTGQAIEAVTTATVQAGVQTAVFGADFEEGFKQALATNAVNQLGEHMAKKIGSAFDDVGGEGVSPLDSAFKYISHAATGCLIGAARTQIDKNFSSSDSSASQNCVVAGGAAVVGEYVATRYRTSSELQAADKTLKEELASNSNKLLIAKLSEEGKSVGEIRQALNNVPAARQAAASVDRLIRQGIDLAKLSAALGAFVAGADASGINLASHVAGNAAEHNALSDYFSAKAILSAISETMEFVDSCLKSSNGCLSYGISMLADGVVDIGVAVADDLEQNHPLVNLALEVFPGAPSPVQATAMLAGLLDLVAGGGVLVDAALRSGADLMLSKIGAPSQGYTLNTIEIVKKDIKAVVDTVENYEEIFDSVSTLMSQASEGDHRSQIELGRVAAGVLIGAVLEPISGGSATALLGPVVVNLTKTLVRLKNAGFKKIDDVIKSLNPDLEVEFKDAKGNVTTNPDEAVDANLSGCFVAGTLVHTIQGLVPIEEIKLGDLVLSKDDVTGHVTYKKVVDVFSFENKVVNTYRFMSEGGETVEIDATPNHPFWVTGLGWVEAGDLNEGDHTEDSVGKNLRFVGASDSRLETVYNFEVEDYHTYFVGELGVWVHNADCSEFIAKRIAGTPGRVQSRINLKNGNLKSGWRHLVNEHFNRAKNKSQFTVSKPELRSLLQSKSVVDTPITRILNDKDGIRFVREVNVGRNIGVDKFSNMQPTSIMTVLTDKFGNLVTATPGLIQ